MEFGVTKSDGKLVAPSEPTPSTKLNLSRIDQLPVNRVNAKTLHVFEPIGPHGAAWSTIREALSKALVPYYPLAGRVSSDGSTIDCTGDGVWFVEASAACSLHSVGYLKDVTLTPLDELLPSHPPESQGLDPLVLMQITEFGDGFVMGLIFSHKICDGLGSAQFLNAVGEYARGVNPLSVDPSWNRDFIPLPRLPTPIIVPPPNATLPDYHLEQAHIDISLDQIALLKEKFMKESLKHCSTFEIVAAVLWQNRTRVIKSGSENKTLMKLVFAANCRPLVTPPLPKGFYGNCFYPVTVTATNETLAQAPIVEVVRMIQAGKARVSEDFANWVREEYGPNNEDHYIPSLGYNTLYMSEWGWLGFNQVDYGSGPPIHVVPMQGSVVLPVAIVGRLPRPSEGVRLMTWCVEKHQLEHFLHSFTTMLHHN